MRGKERGLQIILEPQEQDNEKENPNEVSFRTSAEIFLTLCFIAVFTVACKIYLLCKDLQKDELVFIEICTVLSLVVFTYLMYDSYKDFYPKNVFSEEGISCYLFGIKIKEIKWEDVRQIVCIRYASFGGDWFFVFFSGHELSEKEKKNCIHHLYKQNDVFAIEKKDKYIEAIQALHHFEMTEINEGY